MSRRIAIFHWLLALAAGAFALGGYSGASLAQTRAATPLNIVVYGGSGNAGSRIAKEAAARGHTVTVVDKSPKPDLAPPGVKVVAGDAMDAKDIAKNIAGADAVVSAVIARPTPTPTFAVDIVKAMLEAQRSETGKKPRLIVVGGASSLNNAQGQRIVDTLPAGMGGNNEIKSTVDALDYLLEVKDASWTFFSPSSSFGPGQRTGTFRLGTDTLLTGANGRSAISMEDAAVAILDEIEKPQYINKRFTAGY
ncbi:MAG TPA: NAD(P)H-binding protein [Steroidobacteraceae bacterium]|nr:NAD(P)H-binding protein [Steroidobacteraceae bacterium]